MYSFSSKTSVHGQNNPGRPIKLGEFGLARLFSDVQCYVFTFIVQCWCGEATDDPTIYGTTRRCGRTCLGDISQKCGGVWAMSVYEYTYMS